MALMNDAFLRCIAVSIQRYETSYIHFIVTNYHHGVSRRPFPPVSTQVLASNGQVIEIKTST